MDIESNLKLASAMLVLLVGFVGYRMLHPKTTFAADGLDAAWDRAVQSRDAREPTVVIFTAEWCGACQGLHGNVLSRSDVQDELYQHYNTCTVDLSHPSREVQMHASRLGVNSIPTLIRYDKDGHETDRTHGGSPEQVLAWLKDGE